ncbi:MAG: arginine--tRNA ligase [Sedimentisphaerales bacterium]|nr:arginine--tRNA ligase [Sedimentisphaerales bacterium]
MDSCLRRNDKVETKQNYFNMKPVIEILEDRISAVMSEVAGQEKCSAIIKQASDPKFGDYQVNGVMALAKQIKTNPRKLAEQVVEKLDISDICEFPEIAGPGFINLRLKPEFIARGLLEINKDTENFAVEKTTGPKNIVVDFSGPNIAKQMHVGHLRSTIIGDCICRMLKFLGHNVIPQNHIGDWGLQMGMVIYALEKEAKWTTEDKFPNIENIPDASDLSLEEFERLYKKVTKLVETDPEISKEVKAYTVALHSGDKWTKIIWDRARKISLEQCYKMYKRLKVNLNNNHTHGESSYKDDLSKVVDDLKEKGFAIESDDAICVFPEGFKNKEGDRLPFIIQKSDGAYLYATTDLAAIRYRVNKLKANMILYVTDARQKLHFEMLFAVAELAGWAKKNMLHHVMFGSVLGENGQPLKTRSGENVKLKELLDEAVERAKAVVEQKNPELSQNEKDKIAQAVGIGAVKYADYSNNRTSDYVFSFDKMLAMEGNTAPYMQYAYARIKSIERKAQIKDVDIKTELKDIENLNLSDPSEIELAKHLVRYSEAIQSAVSDFKPNYLTSYLYELAQKFSTFYTSCPVLKAEPEQRPTRLLLCDLTARTIKHGLTELLGIEVVEQM